MSFSGKYLKYKKKYKMLQESLNLINESKNNILLGGVNDSNLLITNLKSNNYSIIITDINSLTDKLCNSSGGVTERLDMIVSNSLKNTTSKIIKEEEFYSDKKWFKCTITINEENKDLILTLFYNSNENEENPNETWENIRKFSTGNINFCHFIKPDFFKQIYSEEFKKKYNKKLCGGLEVLCKVLQYNSSK